MFTDADDAARALVDRRRKPEADRDHAVVEQPSTISSSAARSSSCDSVGRRPLDALRRIRPSRSTTPAAIFVPPTSTPIAEVCHVRGYDTPPDGPGRKALPRLPRRTRRRAGADAAQAGARRRPTRAKPPRVQGPGPKPQTPKGKANWRRRIADRRRSSSSSSCSSGASPATSPLRSGAKEANERLPRLREGRARAADGLDALATRARSCSSAPITPRRIRTRSGFRALRLDHAPAHRPRKGPAQLPLDPARPARDVPGHGIRQDQRGVPARRPGACDPDRSRASPTSR